MSRRTPTPTLCPFPGRILSRGRSNCLLFIYIGEKCASVWRDVIELFQTTLTAAARCGYACIVTGCCFLEYTVPSCSNLFLVLTFAVIATVSACLDIDA